MEENENEFQKKIANDLKYEDTKEIERIEKELIKKIGENARTVLRIIKDKEER